MNANSDVLQRLKEHTRNEHREAEDTLELFRSDFSILEYGALLQNFAEFYAPLETHLQACPGLTRLGFDYGSREKLPWILEDLNHLGILPPDLSAIRGELHPTTLPEILGCLYVIEGSSLGGQVIVRWLAPQLGLSVDRGLKFFGSWGRDVKAMWQELQTFLREHLVSEKDQSCAVESAKRTFQALTEQMRNRPIRHRYTSGQTRREVLPLQTSSL